MKKFFYSVAILSSFAVSSTAAMAGQGNNLPSGPRYMLNVIAFDNCPAGDFTGSNRHMIAVKANFDPYSDPLRPLTGNQAGKLVSEMIKTNTIALKEGSDFQVVDGNACNGGAEFNLPANPYTCPADDPNCLNTDPTFQEYRVFVRLVGKPKTGIGVTTCATQTVIDPDTLLEEDIIVCSTENVVKVRATGQNREKFEDVSKQLLTICLDTDVVPDGTCDVRYPLFASPLQNEFWQWNTSGKAHAQLVFIPNPD